MVSKGFQYEPHAHKHTHALSQMDVASEPNPHPQHWQLSFGALRKKVYTAREFT